MPRKTNKQMRKEARRANHWRYRNGGKVKRRMHKMKKFNRNLATLELINSLKKEECNAK